MTHLLGLLGIQAEIPSRRCTRSLKTYVSGLWRWGMWVFRVIGWFLYSVQSPRPDDKFKTTDVSLIVPTIDCDEEALTEAIRSWVLNEPFEILIITVGTPSVGYASAHCCVCCLLRVCCPLISSHHPLSACSIPCVCCDVVGWRSLQFDVFLVRAHILDIGVLSEARTGSSAVLGLAAQSVPLY
jgi:hypothetical protein